MHGTQVRLNSEQNEWHMIRDANKASATLGISKRHDEVQGHFLQNFNMLSRRYTLHRLIKEPLRVLRVVAGNPT